MDLPLASEMAEKVVEQGNAIASGPFAIVGRSSHVNLEAIPKTVKIQYERCPQVSQAIPHVQPDVLLGETVWEVVADELGGAGYLLAPKPHA